MVLFVPWVWQTCWSYNIVNISRKYGLTDILINAVQSAVIMSLLEFKRYARNVVKEHETKCFKATCITHPTLQLFTECLFDLCVQSQLQGLLWDFFSNRHVLLVVHIGLFIMHQTLAKCVTLILNDLLNMFDLSVGIMHMSYAQMMLLSNWGTMLLQLSGWN
jgi:hypothetical protein